MLIDYKSIFFQHLLVMLLQNASDFNSKQLQTAAVQIYKTEIRILPFLLF